MKIIESLEELKECSKQLKDEGKTLASIDTYGDFHEAHGSLINVANDLADNTIITIDHMPQYQDFSKEKYEEFLNKYKETTFLSDIKFCEDRGVNFISHIPDTTWDMNESFDFVSPFIRKIINSSLRCHKKTIQEWTHLMKELQPTFDVAGEKDFYQKIVFENIIKDLNLPINSVGVPLIRESDGLPYSSRNAELTDEERQRSLLIYKTLKEISEWSSYPSVEEIKKYFIKGCGLVSSARRAYVKKDTSYVWFIDVCDAKTGEPLKIIDKEAAIVVAVNFGKGVYISDNIIIQTG
tara:strand:+ start:1213 stop:2097 length:885 start_codon:yes stop_codon:yes gene_type:complete